jgi:predicted DNA-binding helix-hairpin-helix protein
MNSEKIQQKLDVLADAAKYDVSCASSGSARKNATKGIGSGVSCGICHNFTEDGRCVSLFKILMTNHCIYDCACCINRRTNDWPRATFSVDEIVKLTLGFYRRNFIEGLFLSSGVIKNPDFTMERMVQVAKKLRLGKKLLRIHPPENHSRNERRTDSTGWFVYRSAERQY